MSTLGFTPEGIDGGYVTESDSDRLHSLKNRPSPPTVNGIPISFPPYRYQPYPRALYHVSDPTSPRVVKDEAEERNFLSRGWASEPDKAEQAFEAYYDKDVAIPAAERATLDRHMSPAAKAEVAALEAATDDHVVDVPAPKRSPGRPRKSETTAA